MVDCPNPALRGVLMRTLGPLVPVWMGGLVLAFSLDRLGLTGGPLPLPNLQLFLVFDSLLVLALMGVLAVYQYRSTPTQVRVDLDGVTGWVPRRGDPRDHDRLKLSFPYPALRSVVQGRLFGYRVAARDAGGRPVDWRHLTPSNAALVAAAWQAWRERERGTTD